MFRLLILIFSLIFLCYTRMPTGYNDYYARHKLWPMCDKFVYQNNITRIDRYLDACFYNATFYTHVEQPCDMFTKNNPNITCAGTLLVSHDDEAIILVFRGTVGGQELNEEEQFYNMTSTFPGGGTVAQFYYNGFLIVWNSGFRDAFFSAKNTYPNYELWVTGWSMGGSLAGMAAPYISQMGYFDKANIKMVSFGELRIGHKDFADRYPSLVPYAYRVVHRNDVVPHLIPLEAGYVHHVNEIWYNNNMTEGEPFIECDTEESMKCSDSVNRTLYTWLDHPCFGATGTCEKFTQPPRF